MVVRPGTGDFDRSLNVSAHSSARCVDRVKTDVLSYRTVVPV